jgi:hypothetical protein
LRLRRCGCLLSLGNVHHQRMHPTSFVGWAKRPPTLLRRSEAASASRRRERGAPRRKAGIQGMCDGLRRRSGFPHRRAKYAVLRTAMRGNEWMAVTLPASARFD